MTIINKAKLEKDKYTENQTNSKKKILIYSKDKLVANYPMLKQLCKVVLYHYTLHIEYLEEKIKIYKNELIIIYEKDATPSVLMELRKKLEGGKP